MKPRIIFMGTPDFAVPSLRILLENDYEVVAVITATDKMGGRGGKQLLQSPVKQFALAHGIPVLQPPRLKAPEFIETLQSYQADLQIVVAFRMLPAVVWAMPQLGTFNLHGSLLPKYRGAAPINWAIINGEKETGATTFFIQKEIDTGDLLFQTSTPIGENETAGDVYQRLMEQGAELVFQTVQAIETGEYEAKRQDDTLACPAPKLYHESSEVNFDQAVESVHNFIRGMSPYPAAWAMLDGQKWKFLRTRVELAEHDNPPGQLLSDGKHFLKIAAQGGYVHLDELQVQGKRRMAVKDFLNGFRPESDRMVFLPKEK